MTRTPGTWSTLDLRGKNRRIAIVSSSGHDVASMPAIGYEQQRADALHIVRCVNAHDALVAALRELCADRYLSASINDDRMASARAALAYAAAS